MAGEVGLRLRWTERDAAPATRGGTVPTARGDPACPPSSTRSSVPARARSCASSRRIADQVNAIEDDFVALSDAELRALTDEFRERLADGETLDDLLPEAFATVREAAKRTLGQRHFDVQIMGGAALHLGNIAEMKTGEGKTLVGTAAGVPQRALRQGRARRHGQRLPRRVRVRVDGPGPPLPRPRGRRDPGQDEAGGAPRAVRLRHHLRHQQRVRLRLPARQHGVVPRRARPARPQLRRSSTRSTRSSSTRPARR